MQTYPTAAPVSAVLDLPAARVSLIAADREDTTVEVLPANPARSSDVKAAERVEVSCADGTLHITSPGPPHRLMGDSGTVDITVRLPAGSHLRAKAASTELRGVGRLGDITLDAAQATVRLDETRSARLTLQDGDITITRLTGPAQLSTQRGDLTITEATRGALTLTTQHGDITVGATPRTSATLDAGTALGRIHNSLNNTQGADATLTIHATTAHGDITARSL